ncbi:Uncharacterised protein [Burkholderia pseudomallei]|nr:Uncharacterised protein [Burkholderia pseudomallei]VBT46278.1 Uncharacterised protein [Burkholderia pseudomallei]
MSMSDYEKFVPFEIRLLVHDLVAQARDNLERDGFLAPVAFVGRFDGWIRICAGLNRLSKDEGARLVRLAAKKHDADFVLFIDEAWLKEFQANSLSEARRIRDEVGGEVRDIAGRLDVVMFNLQTHAGVFAAHAERIPLERAPGKYTFGMVEFDRPKLAEGRFVSMLPAREGKQ